MRQLRVLRDCFPGDPALDIAVSHATMRRVAAGEPQHRSEATLARGLERFGVSGRQRVALGERDDPRRAGQPKRLRQFASGHAPHRRVGNRGVEGRIVGEAVVEDAQLAHASEAMRR